jgi:hypothetical protein
MAFDTDAFVTHLRKHAAKRSQSKCAKFVRLALEAGGANTKGHPGLAKEYGSILTRNGFHQITVDKPETFGFLKGDVVVMQPTTQGHQAGHIAAYDGTIWVSDFTQRGFWPGPNYEKEKPTYVVYRR